MVLAYETLDALTGQKALVKKGDALSCECCTGCSDLLASIDAMMTTANGVTFPATNILVADQRGFSETISTVFTRQNTPAVDEVNAVAYGTCFAIGINLRQLPAFNNTETRISAGGPLFQELEIKYLLSVVVQNTCFDFASCFVQGNSSQRTMPRSTRMQMKFVSGVTNYSILADGSQGLPQNVLQGPFKVVRADALENSFNAKLPAGLQPSYTNANGAATSPQSDWYFYAATPEDLATGDGPSRDLGVCFTDLVPAGLGKALSPGPTLTNPFDVDWPDDYTYQWGTPTLGDSNLCLDHSIFIGNSYLGDSCDAGHTITGLDDFFLNFLP